MSDISGVERVPARAGASAPARPRSEAGGLLADRAYVELRDRIIALRLAPGTPLDEDALGRELEIGRTPIREAIKRLALESLVVIFPRRGTFVSEINITDLAHISEVRQQLEGFAAQLAAQRLTAARRLQLHALLKQLQAAVDDRDHDRLIELDARVHRFVYQAAANPYLEETLSRYFNLSLRIWYLVLDRLPHLLDRMHEHAEVLRAIDAGDGQRARRVMAEHVVTFEREIRAVL